MIENDVIYILTGLNFISVIANTFLMNSIANNLKDFKENILDVLVKK